ncbi:MAG: DUF1214 domain-containing protein [Candidatus Binatia bacterium]
MKRRDFMAVLGLAGVNARAWMALAEEMRPPAAGASSDSTWKPSQETGDALQWAAQNLATAITESADFIRRHPFYTDDLNRAAGMTFLSRMLLWALQQKVNGDADYPFFRVVDFNVRAGGDCPYQRYLMADLRGGEQYRIWGTRGTQRGLDAQVYAGTPWKSGTGRSASVLTMEEMQFNADGTFEIALSPERTRGNWLENPPDGTSVLVRQIFCDWRNELPGEVHIDRVGYEGRLKPAMTTAEVARRIAAAAEEFKMECRLWPNFFLERTVKAQPVNTLSPARDRSAHGGRPGRPMSEGSFELADDDALVVTMWPSPATCQGIQLMDDWMASLEYANRQTSLTLDQAYLSSDGAYHFVIAHRDPGVQNWLDTMGLRQGGIIIRYDGLRIDQLPRNRMPVAKKIKLARLRRAIPKDTPTITPAQRDAAIRERRRHVQRRFNL